MKRKIGNLAARTQALGRALATPPARAVTMVYLPQGWPERAGALQWYWRDASGERQFGQVAALAELPHEARAARLIVWTPGAETLLTTAHLPTRARAKILQALPYALEDQLLGEPDSMQFAYRPLAAGRLAVAVTARERLQVWQAQLQAAGLRPLMLAPITLALETAPDGWVAAFIGDELVVRTGTYAGFTAVTADDAPPALLAAALKEAQARGDAPGALTVYAGARAFASAAWSQALGIDVTRSDDNFWTHVEPQPALNLAQTTAASGGDGMHPLLARLRPAAIMFALWLLGSFLFTTFEWWQLGRIAQAQRSEMTAIFRKAFPEAKAIVDPALQMQRNVADLQTRNGQAGPGELLALLTQVGPALAGAQGAELQGLQYGDRALTLDVRVGDFQALEALRAALGAKGLRVELVGSNSRGNAVDGKLRVSPGAAT